MNNLGEPYTKVSNRILEALVDAKLNGSEYRIILFIIRQTYGYQAKGRKLSLSYISNGTGINKAKTSIYINRLVKMNILIITKKHTNLEPQEIKINKNTQMWLELPKKETPELSIW